MCWPAFVWGICPWHTHNKTHAECACRVAELYFVHGVLYFCKAAALESKYMSVPAPADGSSVEAAAAAAGKELLEHASGTMALAYKHWSPAPATSRK